MKITTMYSIMLLLISNRVVTRQEISDRYEMSQRTVQRYIDELIQSGVPIVTKHGRKGGYCISEDYRLDYGFFTREDVGRLRTCLGALAESFKDRLTDELIEKISAYSSADEQPNGSDSGLIIDYTSWKATESLITDKLDAIDAAIKAGLAISLDYTDRGGKGSKRVLEPYSLVLKESAWYVYGWCRQRAQFRVFRIARINSIELTGSAFKKRAEADVRAALSLQK